MIRRKNSIYTAQDLKVLLQDELAALHPGDEVSCDVEGPIARGALSQVFKARCSAHDQNLAIKVCLDPHSGLPSSDIARRQLDGLRRVETAMGRDSKFGVVAALPYLTEAGCTVMEWVDGKTFADILAQRRPSLAEIRRRAKEAGNWLRRFHESHRLATGRIDAETLLRELQIDLVDNSSSFIDAPPVVSALEVLHETGALVSQVELKRSWQHGDFKPENLMISNGRLVGLDLDLLYEGVVVFGIAQFLTHYDLCCLNPATWHLYLWRRQVVREFIAGYEGGDYVVPLLPLAWLQLHRLLRQWAILQHKHQGRLEGLYLSVCMRALTRNYRERLRRLASHAASVKRTVAA